MLGLDHNLGDGEASLLACIFIIRLRLKRLHIRTVVECWNAHADRMRTCQRSQMSRIIGLSKYDIRMTECRLNCMACRMTCYHLSNLGTQIAQGIGQMLKLLGIGPHCSRLELHLLPSHTCVLHIRLQVHLCHCCASLLTRLGSTPHSDLGRYLEQELLLAHLLVQVVD